MTAGIALFTRRFDGSKIITVFLSLALSLSPCRMRSPWNLASPLSHGFCIPSGVVLRIGTRGTFAIHSASPSALSPALSLSRSRRSTSFLPRSLLVFLKLDNSWKTRGASRCVFFRRHACKRFISVTIVLPYLLLFLSSVGRRISSDWSRSEFCKTVRDVLSGETARINCHGPLPRRMNEREFYKVRRCEYLAASRSNIYISFPRRCSERLEYDSHGTIYRASVQYLLETICSGFCSSGK